MKKILLLILLLSIETEVYAQLIVPPGYKIPFNFKNELRINSLHSRSPVEVQLLGDVIIDGQKVFDKNSQAFAKIQHKRANKAAVLFTGFGRGRITIPEITVYDVEGQPHRFTVSRKENKFKKFSYVQRARMVSITNDPIDAALNLIPTDPSFIIPNDIIYWAFAQ